MTIKIMNPNKDMQGNVKENIFLVFDDQTFIGSGYVFPKLSPQITPQHVLNIFIDMHFEGHVKQEVVETLYKALYKRSLALKHMTDLTAYVYYGATESNMMMKFLEDKGFDTRYKTYLMSSHVVIQHKNNPFYKIKMATALGSDKEAVMNMHNKLFIRTLSEDHLHHMMHQSDFRWAYIKEDGVIIASMMFFNTEDNVGMIDHIYVVPKYQNRGIGLCMISFAQKFFKERFVTSMQLEVWSANERALNWYQKMGFEVLDETEIYIGKLLIK